MSQSTRVAKLEKSNGVQASGPTRIIVRGIVKAKDGQPVEKGKAFAWVIGVQGSISKLEGESETEFSWRLQAVDYLGRHPDQCTDQEISDALQHLKETNQLEPYEAA